MSMLPTMSVYLITSISMLSYAIQILSHESQSITIGIQSMRSANIHDRLMIMTSVCQSAMRRSISSVSHEILKDLNSQLQMRSKGIMYSYIIYFLKYARKNNRHSIYRIFHFSLSSRVTFPTKSRSQQSSSLVRLCMESGFFIQVCSLWRHFVSRQLYVSLAHSGITVS